jgi:pimeloyl-ACP methyl ester carboxylesterase
VPITVPVRSEAELLQCDLYGSIPAKRAAVLCHGQNWDALGWRDVAPRFVERGVPALAVNLRGYGGSSGRTDKFVPGERWSPMIDVVACARLLRERGADEIALVGASLGGHAVLAAAMQEDVECVVSISAPVGPVPDDLSAKVRGRKLYVCASDDRGGAAEHVLASFRALAHPKQLIFFGGDEHSRHMFVAPYGQDAIRAIVDFVAHGL